MSSRLARARAAGWLSSFSRTLKFSNPYVQDKLFCGVAFQVERTRVTSDEERGETLDDKAG